MISVEEAIDLIERSITPRGPVNMPADRAVGLETSVDAKTDVDSPPHDKSLVDGYAIQIADLEAGNALSASKVPTLEVIEEVTAGQVPQQSVASGQAIRIMTGAPVPSGADAVVMVEETSEEQEEDRTFVQIRSNKFSTGQNIMPKATAYAKGTVVVPQGHVIAPIDVGVLAEAGAYSVSVKPRPSVAILATGNELVDPTETPGPGAIRNSNGPMLTAQAEQAGATVTNLGIARDDRQSLSESISAGLEHDILILSGGVSAGVLDLVPSVLQDLGVEQVFHKANLKPGKPIWFGTTKPTADSGQTSTLVFGLPGNPVSSFVCFEIFVRHAIDQLADRSVKDRKREATLSVDFQLRDDRETFWPGVVLYHGYPPMAVPLDWSGSSDMASLVKANCLIRFPIGQGNLKAQTPVSIYRIR